MKKVYDEMWQQSFPLLKTGKIVTDSLINSMTDTRRGLTLRIRPSAEINHEIQAFIQKAKLLEPHQYFYPSESIHLTVMSIISGTPEFNLNQINSEEYQEVLEAVIPEIQPFQLTFEGITASKNSILIQGFDNSGTLNSLRKQLREKFKHSRLRNSIDKRYKIQTAHITVVRFTQNLKPDIFADYLQEYKNTLFGTFQVKNLELVFNDWYHSQKLVEKIATFQLKKIT